MNNLILFAFAVVIVLSWMVHPGAVVVPAVEAASYILERNRNENLPPKQPSDD